jgi:hypothetical protein
MTQKTYPRSMQRPISSSCAQPFIIGRGHRQSDELIKEVTQLLAGLSAEQDVLLAPLENTEVHLPGTWREMGSMA